MAQSVGVSVVKQNGVATVTMQGEKKVNIIGRALTAALVQALEKLRQDEDLRLVVLTGPPGGSFLGGVNIAEMVNFTPDAAREFITLLHHACHALRVLPVPSIARVEGFCLGGGLEVAAACDMRVGSAGSTYGMPETQVGLPSVIEARLLPTLIGWGKTREILYRGNVFGAEEALRMGFLNAVAPEGGVDATMQPWIDDILRADARAVRIQKRLIEGWMETPPAVGVQASIDAFAETFHTDAPNQRLRAFINRPRGKK
ncbi:MAG TPA: enoyl-CoA hydratase-related protein [bacterium]